MTKDTSLSIGPSNASLSIFLVSILGLFLEMMLIRWIGTEIRVFAYLQNTILVTCFLGLGLGCFTSHREINLRSIILPLFVITLILAIPVSRKALGAISEMLSVMKDLTIFYHGISSSGSMTVLWVLLGLSLTYLVMLLILDMFVPIGRILGRLLDNHPNTIWAYSVNIFGSLIGTWLFVLMSRFYAPPVLWCSLVVLLLFGFLNEAGRTRIINLALCLGLVILSWFAGMEPGALDVVWSPYQKLVVRKTNPQKGEIGKYFINVNNVLYQEMVDLDPNIRNVQSNKSDRSIDGYSQYDIQLLLHPNPKKMLILGSGAGNDAAGGLRHNVQKITAVEIDPAIISLGRLYHPQKPYDSPKVKIVNDDARSFFATCRERFDVISFGLLDSHTSSAMTNTRLDEYVFTEESIKRAKSLLADGGVLSLHSSAPEFFIADRLAKALREIFGKEPISFLTPPNSKFGYGGVMFITGDLTGAKKQIEKDPLLKSLIEKWQQQNPLNFTYSTRISTDDWPYLYLKTAQIPLLYYLLAGLMILLFIRSCKHWEAPGVFLNWNRSHWHFFFLGAAFMLLEVQNISKAAVVLGSTWIVNAVIVSGVLFMILMANLIAAKFQKIPLLPVYIILLGICISLFFVDLASFAFLPYLFKAILVGCLATFPMIFSGIIFINSFSNCEKKDEALGANLFGGLIGALLQSITFITGIKALLLVVAGLYFLSLLSRPVFTSKLHKN